MEIKEERNKFIDWLKSKKLAHQTIYHYIGYYDKIKPAQNMNQKRVNSFLKTYKYNSVVKAFISNYRIFILTNEDDYDKEIIDNARSILMPRETGGRSNKIPDVITKSDVCKIEKYFDSERDKLMLLLSFYCGLRVGGLVKIKLDNFKWREWWDSKGKDLGELKVIEKGDKERIVFVLPELMNRVHNWVVTIKEDLDESKPLFRISGRRWRYLLRSCSEKALNKPIHPHTLRHSCATHLLNKGMNIERVQKLLGHKSITSTQIYTHIVQKDLKEDYAKLIDY